MHGCCIAFAQACDKESAVGVVRRAVVLVVLYLAGIQGALPAWAKSAAFLLMQKGTLATAMFAVVMFVGVFPRDSKVRLRLAPIRAELSVIACILILGHMVAYSISYVPRVLGSAVVSPFVLGGLVAALLLTVLLLVLGPTSLATVKARMAAKTWTKVQKWAYVFYGLMYLHVLAMLLPSALRGGEAAVQNVIAYTVVFGVYAVARIARAVVDAKGERAS